MKQTTARKYGRAFVEILFLRPRPVEVADMSVLMRVMLYAPALILFYIPILAFTVLRCVENHELIPYCLAIGAVHVLARVMLAGSKRIHTRFSALRRHRSFFLRLWLIIEYILFMWVVYLFYPLACILAPVSLLVMSAEGLLGGRMILELFINHAEQFIRIGSMCSYIAFIVADGYKKLRTGFLPDYLGLYALLSVLSGAAKGAIERMLGYFNMDLSNVTTVMSEIFALSNSSMNLVASVMTLFFAIFSLYTSENQPEAPTAPVEDGEAE